MKELFLKDILQLNKEELEIEKLYELMDIPGFEQAADQHFEEFLQL